MWYNMLIRKLTAVKGNDGLELTKVKETEKSKAYI